MLSQNPYERRRDTTTTEDLFMGFEVSQLPPYLMKRFAPILETAQSLYNRQLSAGVAPDWYVKISSGPRAGGADATVTRGEWIEYQYESDFPDLPVRPEAYGYWDNTYTFEFSVIDRRHEITSYSAALEIFKCLDSQTSSFQTPLPESARMGSYDLLRCARFLDEHDTSI